LVPQNWCFFLVINNTSLSAYRFSFPIPLRNGSFSFVMNFTIFTELNFHSHEDDHLNFINPYFVLCSFFNISTLWFTSFYFFYIFWLVAIFKVMIRLYTRYKTDLRKNIFIFTWATKHFFLLKLLFFSNQDHTTHSSWTFHNFFQLLKSWMSKKIKNKVITLFIRSNCVKWNSF
jgi:hypothetical protein